MLTRLLSAALLVAAAFFAIACASTSGDGPVPIRAATVTYGPADAPLVGYLAMPEHARGPRPVVLVVHEWWGRTAHADQTADGLARLGYVGFALDMYGDGRSTSDPKEAGAWAGAVRGDPAVLLARLHAALDFVRSVPQVDASRVACIGFCFGGTVSLEAAWAGEDLKAVVSFHGNLTTPSAEQAPNVKPSILVCHGADDPFVGKDAVDAFQQSMREHGYDWEFASFGGAVHSFTNPAADGSFNPGAKFHPTAAFRAWRLATEFLAEHLADPPR